MMRPRDIDQYDSSKNTARSRLEVTLDSAAEEKLIDQYQCRNVRVVYPSEVYVDEKTLIYPARVLDKLLELANDTLVVRGMSRYLMMWHPRHSSDFFQKLMTILDKQESKIVVVLEGIDRNLEIVRNEKYSGSGALVFLKSNDDSVPGAFNRVTIVDSEQAPYLPKIDSIKEFVKSICSCDSRRMFAVDNLCPRPADLTGAVTWLNQPSEVLGAFWKPGKELPDDVAQELSLRSRNHSKDVESFLSDEVGGVTDVAGAAHTLASHASDSLFPAYAIYFRSKLPPDSYLHHVISSSIEGNSFVHSYIVDVALECISDSSVHLASERRAGIMTFQGYSVGQMIGEFVQRSQANQDAVPWLNCGTDSEYTELIRRAGQCILHSVLPDSIATLYPELEYYLGLDYRYEPNHICQYFILYRINKISNTLSQDYIDLACSIDISKLSSRREVISSFCDDGTTALLVVDAMGLEYLPMLIKLLKHRGLVVERAECVTAEYPTITERNEIEWNHKVQDVKGLDNVAHDGAIKHEATSLYENIQCSLKTVQNDVVNRVLDALNQYERVIITADHGATRMAVLANDLGLSHTLDAGPSPDHWRYTKAPEGMETPPGTMVVWIPNTDDKYWLIKGYDRFKKSGGPKYEVHGGASAEEVVVPLIVVSRGGHEQCVEIDSTEVDVGTQIVERDLFAGL